MGNKKIEVEWIVHVDMDEMFNKLKEMIDERNVKYEIWSEAFHWIRENGNITHEVKK